MTQLNPVMSSSILGTSLSSNVFGNAFCMTVDPSHGHQKSSGKSSFSTLRTYIDQITLQDKLMKQKRMVRLHKKAVAYWSKQQIITLVDLLRKYGSDFTMIATHMTKSRDQIKRKFKVLEKKNASLAGAIFQNQIPCQTLKNIPEQMEMEQKQFLCV